MANRESSREVSRTRVNLRILVQRRYEWRVPQRCRLAVAQEQHIETARKMIVKGIKDKAGVAVVPPPVSRIRGVVAEKLIWARSA
jgi:hypothetical protein